MPISLPDGRPAFAVAPRQRIRLPVGSWLVVCWTIMIMMLAVGLWGSFGADPGAMDEFQLLANF